MVFQHILGNFYFKKKSEFENIFPNMGRVHSNSRSGVDSTGLSAKSQQICQRVHMESTGVHIEYQGDRKALHCFSPFLSPPAFSIITS